MIPYYFWFVKRNWSRRGFPSVYFDFYSMYNAFCAARCLKDIFHRTTFPWNRSYKKTETPIIAYNNEARKPCAKKGREIFFLWKRLDCFFALWYNYERNCISGWKKPPNGAFAPKKGTRICHFCISWKVLEIPCWIFFFRWSRDVAKKRYLWRSVWSYSGALTNTRDIIFFVSVSSERWSISFWRSFVGCPVPGSRIHPSFP